jgi:hypothetical protein
LLHCHAGTPRQGSIGHRKTGYFCPSAEVTAYLIGGDRTAFSIRDKLGDSGGQCSQIVTDGVH